jgi:hypothetical protein
MFGRKKEDAGPIIEARATVTSIQDTGTTVNGNPRVKLTLQVQPDGAEPWELSQKVNVSRIHIPKPGDPFTVKYYAGKPDGARLQRRTEAELAAAAGDASATAAAAPPAVDPLDRLRKLNELRQAGALTDEEFEQQKAKVLENT